MQLPFVPTTIIFADHPEFTPNLTPYDIFAQGSFGGSYWRKVRSGVTGFEYQLFWTEIPILAQMVEQYPESRVLLESPSPNKKLNKYGVDAGSSLEDWEKQGWIQAQDPYGWVQWYCRFYYGRRSADDARQIERWLNFAGPKGRFRRNLINQIKKKGTSWDNNAVSPKIRQGLHHWAYCLTEHDFLN